MPDPSTLDDKQLPARFGRYELLRVLGTGGMGRVFEADLVGPAGFRKRVAIKVVHSDRDEADQELVFEARLGGMMSHPNIVDTFELGAVDDSLFVAMELVRGPTLTRLLRQGGGLPARAALELLLQFGSGLAHAHQLEHRGQRLGVVHRDLKPANILLTPHGLVKIADFGIAVLTEGRTVANNAGTPGYMAPEVHLGEPIDARTDLFSFGVIAWEVVSGQRLLSTRYGQKRVARLVTLQRRMDSDPFRRPVQDVVPGLLPIVLRCLQEDPDKRFPSAAALVDALRAVDVPSSKGLAEVLADRGLGTDRSQALSTLGTATGAPSTLGRPQHNLGPESDGFFGRNAELQYLHRVLDEAGGVAVLKGPGGAGKTRLSRRFGLEIAPELAGGAWFADLSEATDEAGVLLQVVRALDLVASHDPASQIRQALADRGPVLLILDNAEQVVQVVAKLVSAWHSAARDARFLVTSRERLRVRGEQVIEVGRLGIEAGVALFTERAKARGWEQGPNDRDTIEAIVERLDGMPLALELAAARARMLPLAEILRHLEQRFRLLKNDDRDAPWRQSSLHAAILGSWEVLSPAARSALAQLSAFAGSFTLQAAENIVDLPPDAPWILEIVETLIDSSLLTAEAGTTPRFGMFESIRAFATAELDKDPVGARAARIRHASHFAARGRASWQQHETGGGFADLEPELANLVHATRFALDIGEHGLAVDLAGGAARVMRGSGPYLAGADLIRDVRLAARTDAEHQVLLVLAECQLLFRVGDVARMSEALEDLDGLAGLDAPAADRHRAAMARSYRALLQAKWDEARLLLEEARSAAAEGEMWNGQAHALRNLGMMAGRSGDLDLAGTLTQQALGLHVAHGDRGGTIAARLNLANVVKDRGDLKQAEALLRAVIAEASEFGDRGSLSVAHGNIAVILMHQGRLNEAVRHFHRSIRRHQANGASRLEGSTRLNLSAALLQLNRPAEALAQVDIAARLLQHSGSVIQVCIAHQNRGLCLTRLGRYEEARYALASALEVADGTTTSMLRGSALVALGELDLAEGDVASARERVDEALPLLENCGEEVEYLNGCCLNAEVKVAEGRSGEAAAILETLHARMDELGIGPRSGLGIRTSAIVSSLSHG